MDGGKGTVVRSSRKGVALAASIAAVSVLAACSASPKPPVPTATKTVSSGPHVLTFQVYGPPPVVAAYTRIAADFSEYKNQAVVVKVRPFDSHAASLAAHPEEKADLFLAERSDLGALADSQAIEPVDTLLGERNVDFGDGFQREALEAFSGDDSLLCMPTDTSPMVVYVNTRLVDLARLTPPGDHPITADTGWNLDQFAAAARQSSHGRIRGLYVAPSIEGLAPFIWAGGGQVVDDVNDPTTLEFSDGDSRDAIEKVLELVRDSSLTFSAQQLRQTSALELFKSGRLALLPGYRDLTPVLRQQPNLSFDVMPMPRLSHKATTGTMSGLCISKRTKLAGDAADFIAYAVSEGPSALLARTGYITPTNLATVNSPAFLQPGQQPASAQVFPNAIRYLQRLPLNGAWPTVEASSSRLLNRLFFDPVIDPLEDRLAEIDTNSRAIFARYAAEQAAKQSESPSPSPSK